MLFISKVADDVKKGVYIYFNVMQYMHVKRKVNNTTYNTLYCNVILVE